METTGSKAKLSNYKLKYSRYMIVCVSERELIGIVMQNLEATLTKLMMCPLPVSIGECMGPAVSEAIVCHGSTKCRGCSMCRACGCAPSEHPEHVSQSSPVKKRGVNL